MKKAFIFVFLFLYIMIPTSVASEVDIEKFLNTVKSYNNELFPNLNDENIIDEIISGEAFADMNLINKILNMFLGEIREHCSVIFTIIAVSILCSVLKNIQSSFGGSVSEIAFYTCYILIVILIVTSYTEIIDICRETILKLNDFMNTLIPLIFSLLLANGNITSVGMMQPVLLGIITIINTIISNVILPIIFISTMINLIGNVAENIDFSGIPKLLQNCCTWVLEIMLIIFTGVLSLEGTLAANVDGITAKATKSVVSTVIPVVGKALSDATDSVIGAVSITKNAVGIIGVLMIVGISAIPLIKVFTMMIIYNVAGAVITPIVDKRISKCMSDIGSSIKIIFGIMATVCFIFIISTTIMIKVGNFSLMYR